MNKTAALNAWCEAYVGFVTFVDGELTEHLPDSDCRLMRELMHQLGGYSVVMNTEWRRQMDEKFRAVTKQAAAIVGDHRAERLQQHLNRLAETAAALEETRRLH
jgi:hypothetical protein